MLRTTFVLALCLFPLMSFGQIISLFEFDTPVVTGATIGPDAYTISSSAFSDVGGVGGTTGLNAGNPKMDIDMYVTGSPTFDINGIDLSLDFQREENVGEFWRRGNSLIFGGASNLSVSYRVEDGAGGYNTVNSGNVYAIPNDDTFRNYRFVYLPATGMGMLFVDGALVWSNDGPDFRNLYWTGAGDVHIGNNMDGNGNGNTFMDNVQVGVVFDSPLPVELNNFDANVTLENEVLLSWETLSERENDYFTIEKTRDGLSWEIVGKVDGAGNSTETNYYSLTDETPYVGISYYRLKQTDYNGKTTTYEEIPVEIRQSIQVNVYPNPAQVNDVFTISIKDQQDPVIEIYTTDGRSIMFDSRKTMDGLEVSTLNWKAGIYIVSLMIGEERVQKRISIQ